MIDQKSDTSTSSMASQDLTTHTSEEVSPLLWHNLNQYRKRMSVLSFILVAFALLHVGVIEAIIPCALGIFTLKKTLTLRQYRSISLCALIVGFVSIILSPASWSVYAILVDLQKNSSFFWSYAGFAGFLIYTVGMALYCLWSFRIRRQLKMQKLENNNQQQPAHKTYYVYLSTWSRIVGLIAVIIALISMSSVADPYLNDMQTIWGVLLILRLGAALLLIIAGIILILALTKTLIWASSMVFCSLVLVYFTCPSILFDADRMRVALPLIAIDFILCCILIVKVNSQCLASAPSPLKDKYISQGQQDVS